MASTEMTTTPDAVKTVPESGDPTTDRLPPNYFRVDFLLRLLLLASAVSALVVLVTSKETKAITVPLIGAVIHADAKFNYSPALIYLLVALAVTSLYSFATMMFSCAVMSRPAPSAKILFSLILFDIMMAAIMASALGTAGGVAYIGLKGNTHTGWLKICDVYGKFCRHMGASIFVSLVASIILVLLIVLNLHILYIIREATDP